MIEQFTGEYSWLSNFALVDITLNDIEYPSVEHAYQSAKSNDKDWKLYCQNKNIKPGWVKTKSKNINVIPNWHNIKIDIMKECLNQKFRKEPYKTLLTKTKLIHIQEGNYHNDKFYGVCLKTGKGKNILGKMIMEIRSGLLDFETLL